ncbi:hypothetical protein [Halobacterium wangiae]|uniref:hypothetical protein n=1 Tax=Halobacterium wangiae TaxID=2902623 RepID=UPI001E2E07FE|nr:hypothetical protein [Halobacterium wangiae]
MERRRFLAGLTATVPLALAGCIGGQDDEDDTSTTAPTDDTTTQTPDDTTTTTTDSGPLSVGDAVSLGDGRELAVVDAGASAFAVTRGTGAEQVHASDDERFVTVKFAPTGIDDYQSFVAENVTLTINDEETFADPVFPLGGGSNRFDAAYAIPRDLTPYTATVSVETGSEAASWEFDSRDIESVTQNVDFSVGELSVPDSVPAGEGFTAELPVDNGGGALTFYAVVQGTANAPTRISEDLPASEETVVEIQPTAPDTDGEFDLTVDWSAGSATKTVQLE